MTIHTAERMRHFRPGVFSSLAAMKRKRLSEGLEVIDFSIGSPNIPPPLPIRQTLVDSAMDGCNYVYSLGDLPELRRAAAGWYTGRYGVELDPETEILSLYGSQDGLAHFFLAMADPGDLVLVPDPFFPSFVAGARLAGARLGFLPLRPENDFLIDLDAIPEDVADEAKIMVVSYPNNPTSATAPDSFYRDLIRFAERHSVMILHDNAYSDLVYDGPPGKSFLAFEGAKDVGVEFNSLSKTYSLAGARMGFCLGNREICRAMSLLKSNVDLGSFLGVQKAAIAALAGDQRSVAELRAAYRHRRDVLCQELCGIGWECRPAAATLFMWVPLPGRLRDSETFVRQLFEKTGVLMLPGSALGSMGEGFVRLSLVQDEANMRKAVLRIAEVIF